MKKNVINLMLGLFVAVVVGFAGCGGGGGGSSNGKVTDACVEATTCTDFTDDRASNQFNCTSMTQGHGVFHPGESCAQLNIAPSVSVSISPATASVQTGTTATFTASVTGSTNTGVTWSVVENGGGIISSSGIYTAPSTVGTYHVKAVSSANSSISATAIVTVSAPQLPAAPTGINAVAGDSKATVSWSSVSGATSYNIYWSTTSGVTKTSGTKVTNATSPYNHTGLANSTTYYYVVTAVNGVGESLISSQASVTPSLVLAAPTGVSATAGNGQNSISWSTVSGANLYNIYWSTTSGVSKTSGTKIANVTSPYTHTGIANGTTYYYVVTTVNGIVESPVSSQANATPTNVPKNVALSIYGATATAISTGYYSGSTQYPSLAIDNETTTFWASQWSMPAWLKVQFDNIYTISKVGIWVSAHQHTFSISLSQDGINWTEVVPARLSSYNAGLPVHDIIDITPMSAKFIKFNILTTTAPSSHIFQSLINEIEAFE